MYIKSGIFALLVLFGLAFSGFVGGGIVDAQQTESKPAAAPTPPEPIEEEDKVEKIETIMSMLIGTILRNTIA